MISMGQLCLFDELDLCILKNEEYSKVGSLKCDLINWNTFHNWQNFTTRKTPSFDLAEVKSHKKCLF